MFKEKKKVLASFLVLVMVFMFFANGFTSVADSVSAESAGGLNDHDNTSWNMEESNGFQKGKPNYSANEMIEFNGRLYVSVANYEDGVEIWKKDGAGWTKVNEPGFGRPENMAVTSMEVFQGQLYAGTFNMIDGAMFYRYDGEDWTEVNNGFSAGNLSTGMNIAATALEVHENELYAGVTNVKLDWDLGVMPMLDDLPIAEIIKGLEDLFAMASNGGEIWAYDNDKWEIVSHGGIDDPENWGFTALESHKGTLYAGSVSARVELDIHFPEELIELIEMLLDILGLEESTQPAAIPGFLLDLIVEQLVKVNVSLTMDSRGATLFAYEDEEWERIATDGFGDKQNLGVSTLHVHDEDLFLGTINIAETSQPFISIGDLFSKGELKELLNSLLGGLMDETGEAGVMVDDLLDEIVPALAVSLDKHMVEIRRLLISVLNNDFSLLTSLQTDGGSIFRYTEGNMEKVEAGLDADDYGILAMESVMQNGENHLLVSLGNNDHIARLIKFDGEEWQEKEFITDDDSHAISSLSAVGNAVYAGTANWENGCSVWQQQIDAFTIAAAEAENGDIRPSGDVGVAAGKNQTFTITPHEGYAIEKVFVDGKPVGVSNSYTFKNVTSPHHTIDAEFAYYPPGDVSRSGEVDISDAILILRHTAGLIDLRDVQNYGHRAYERGKVSKGEELGVPDALLILRYIVGLVDELEPPVMEIEEIKAVTDNVVVPLGTTGREAVIALEAEAEFEGVVRGEKTVNLGTVNWEAVGGFDGYTTGSYLFEGEVKVPVESYAFADHLDLTVGAAVDVQKDDFTPDQPYPALHQEKQGVCRNQRDTADKVLDLLTAEPLATAGMIVSYDAENHHYYVHDHTGMISFTRHLHGTGFSYKIQEIEGQNPLSPGDTDYPNAFERIATLFDDPRAPEMVIIDEPYRSGGSIGKHGTMEWIHSQAILAAGGRGIEAGAELPSGLRNVDVAPTIAKLMGVREVTGRTLSGVESDGLYLKWQDGEPIEELLDGSTPDQVILVLWDGARPKSLNRLLEEGQLPNLSRVLENGSLSREGMTVELPSVSVNSHTTIAFGAYNGRHGIIYPEWYERETGTVIPENDLYPNVEELARPYVESIFEAVKRTYSDAYTVAINQWADRGADYSTFHILENLLDLLGPILSTDEMTMSELMLQEAGASSIFELLDSQPVPIGNPRYLVEGERINERHLLYTILDNLAISQALAQWEHRPKFMFINQAHPDGTGHEGGPDSDLNIQGYRDADTRLGILLDRLEETGDLDNTAIFIVSDHGMGEAIVDDYDRWHHILRDEGINFHREGRLLYLFDLDVSFSPTRDELDPEKHEEFTVTVLDNFTHQPVSEAKVTFIDAEGNPHEEYTDEDGKAVFAVELVGDESKAIVTHVDYNEAKREYSLQVPVDE